MGSADRTSPWAAPMAADARAAFLARVHSYAAGVAATSLARDRAGADPVAELAAARDAGLFALMAPVESGGLGGDWATAFEATRRIATADPSLAQLIGYSWLNEATIGFVGDADAQRRWYRASTGGGWFWADAVNPTDPDLTVTPADDGAAPGWTLDGVKRYASGAVVSDRILVLATDAASADAPPRFFAVPAARAGVVHAGDWDALGQRRTASGGVRFESVALTDADLIAPSPRDAFALLQPPGIQVMFAHLYLGIAQGALAQATAVIRAKGRPWPTSPAATHAEDPDVIRLIGALDASVAALAALAERTAGDYDAAVRIGPAIDWDARAAASIGAARLKIVATDTVLEVTSRVFEATGASATASAVGLDRWWRDARTHTLHDPVALKRAEVGAWRLTGTPPTPSLYS